jgi:hypothetical protein
MLKRMSKDEEKDSEADLSVDKKFHFTKILF